MYMCDSIGTLHVSLKMQLVFLRKKLLQVLSCVVLLCLSFFLEYSCDCSAG